MVNLIPVKSSPQIEQVAQLAEDIWNQHYPPIIGQEQVDYMLLKLQNPQAIAEQIEAGCQYFLIEFESEVVGYAGLNLEHNNSALFLSKIYVQDKLRGRGVGKNAMQQIIAMAKQHQLDLVWLTVNKNNVSAIKAYHNMGFVNAGSVVMEVGGGFVMDDFRMELHL